MSDYIFHVEPMLNYGQYSKLKKDSSTKPLSDNKKVVRSVFHYNNTKRLVIFSIPNCAHFYSLPKVHKPTLSFCPIVSNIDNASYKLAMFLPM